MKVLGSYNEIQLVELEDGTELYYSPRTRNIAFSITGLAKLVQCEKQTIAGSELIRERFKELQLCTKHGVHRCMILVQEDIVFALQVLANGSRTKSTTRNRALKLMKHILEVDYDINKLQISQVVTKSVTTTELRKPGYVYFLEDTKTGRIKIGCSKSPKKRLIALQTCNLSLLILLGTIQTSNMYQLERKYHNEFKDYKLGKEWFDPCVKLSILVKLDSSNKVKAQM